jgi:hypothetical protein
VSFAAIEARVRAKARRADPRRQAVRFAAADRARREANLKADGIVIPLSELLGHNKGPTWNADARYIEFCWREAHEKAWTPPSHETGVRWARKAEALGVSYHRYVLEILERGRYLTKADVAAMREDER